MDIMGMQKEMQQPPLTLSLSSISLTTHVPYNLKWSFLAGYKIFVIY